MSGSASGQDEANSVFWLATRAGKMGLSFPLGISCLVLAKAKFFGVIFWPYNKSFIDQACSVKVAGYLRGQYPAILTEQAWLVRHMSCCLHRPVQLPVYWLVLLNHVSRHTHLEGMWFDHGLVTWFSPSSPLCSHRLTILRSVSYWGSHLIESYLAVLSCDTVYYTVEGDSKFWGYGWNLKCDHSHKSYWAVLSCGAVYYAVQGGSKFCGCVWNPKVWPFKWKLLSSTFLWCCPIVLYKVVLTFESVGEILTCDHSNESYWAVLSCGAVYYAVYYAVAVYESLGVTIQIVLFIMQHKTVLTFQSVDEFFQSATLQWQSTDVVFFSFFKVCKRQSEFFSEFRRSPCMPDKNRSWTRSSF